MIKGYKISANYTQVKIWEFDNTQRLVGTYTSIPFKTFNRYNRYEVISKRLEQEGILPPKYVPTKKEAAKVSRCLRMASESRARMNTYTPQQREELYQRGLARILAGTKKN